MRFQFVMACWGAEYTALFLRHALPSLLTTGNLLGFAAEDAEFDLYTTAPDFAVMQKSPAFAALWGAISIRVVTAEKPIAVDGLHKHRYAYMNTFHRMAVTRSFERDAAIVFLAPDVIFADGTLASARRGLAAGKRAIFMLGVRADRDAFVPEMKARFNPQDRIFMAIPPRELADLAVRFPHRSVMSARWDAAEFTSWPSHVYFPVGNEGYVIRAFHLHPIALYPTRKDLMPENTLDDGYAMLSVPDSDQWYVMQDSDEGFAVDPFTDPSQRPATERYPDRILHLAKFVHRFIDEKQRPLVAAAPVFLHANPLTPPWQDVVRDSGEVLAQTYRRVEQLTPEELAVEEGVTT